MLIVTPVIFAKKNFLNKFQVYIFLKRIYQSFVQIWFHELQNIINCILKDSLINILDLNFLSFPRILMYTIVRSQDFFSAQD